MFGRFLFYSLMDVLGNPIERHISLNQPVKPPRDNNPGSAYTPMNLHGESYTPMELVDASPKHCDTSPPFQMQPSPSQRLRKSEDIYDTLPPTEGQTHTSKSHKIETQDVYDMLPATHVHMNTNTVTAMSQDVYDILPATHAHMNTNKVTAMSQDVYDTLPPTNSKTDILQSHLNDSQEVYDTLPTARPIGSQSTDEAVPFRPPKPSSLKKNAGRVSFVLPAASKA